MDNYLLLDGLNWFSTGAPDNLSDILENMVRTESKSLVLMPDPANAGNHVGILLEKYFTSMLLEITGVRGSKQEGDFRFLFISSSCLRGFLINFTRKVSLASRGPAPAIPPESSSNNPPVGSTVPTPTSSQASAALDFLKSNTPAQIQRELNTRVLGQNDLTAAVADFLYYHALRQLHPQLPLRPLMIAGPSGSGKTEVWRAARSLYGNTFSIQIIDGSNLSCEGWSGNYKLATYIDRDITKGGILVVDEFDKLVKPKHSSSGDNVSLDMQAEFLKLMEGEYQITEKREKTGITTKAMGFVFVGAFESLRAAKAPETAVAPIGFHTQSRQENVLKLPSCDSISDEAFIRYGIMPEIVGRIATKCTTRALTEKDYMQIVQAPNSRVAMISDVLKCYGIRVSDVISDQELKELIAASRGNRTGVRWVSAQVETRLLAAIREQGLFPVRVA